MFEDTYIKRRDVFKEGVKMPNGLTILKGALVVQDEQIPIRFVPSPGTEWDGWGEKFQRDNETDTISFELHCDRPLDDFKMNLTATNLKFNGPGKNRDVKYGVIREIVCYLSGANPTPASQ